MAHQIHFKHLHGTIKNIPGVKHADLAPKMTMGKRFVDQLGKEVPVLVQDPNHVVRISLLDEDPSFDLGPGAEKLPPAIRQRLEEDMADQFLARVRANKEVRAVLQDYVDRGAVEVLFDGPVTAQEEKKLGAIQVDMSEIAINDHIERGIPIPDHVRRAQPQKTKAAEKKAREIKSEAPAPAPAPDSTQE